MDFKIKLLDDPVIRGFLEQVKEEKKSDAIRKALKVGITLVNDTKKRDRIKSCDFEGNKTVNLSDKDVGRERAGNAFVGYRGESQSYKPGKGEMDSRTERKIKRGLLDLILQKGEEERKGVRVRGNKRKRVGNNSERGELTKSFKGSKVMAKKKTARENRVLYETSESEEGNCL